jgi:hypothetical protein
MSDTIREAQGDAAVLRYKGVFDFDGLTTYIINWLKARGNDLVESKHKHKMSCPFGFEIEWDVKSWRKLDDYFKHNINVSMHLWDAHQVDAVKDGKKVKLWNARIQVTTSFSVECDYQGRWEKSQFLEKLRNFYDQYVIKKEIIAKQADPLYYKCLELHTGMKKFIGMETTHYR